MTFTLYQKIGDDLVALFGLGTGSMQVAISVMLVLYFGVLVAARILCRGQAREVAGAGLTPLGILSGPLIGGFFFAVAVLGLVLEMFSSFARNTFGESGDE